MSELPASYRPGDRIIVERHYAKSDLETDEVSTFEGAVTLRDPVDGEHDPDESTFTADVDGDGGTVRWEWTVIADAEFGVWREDVHSTTDLVFRRVYDFRILRP